MRQYIISEERLKDFIRHERELFCAHECVFYSPSEKELEVTEENLKRFKELNEYIKEHRDEILHDNAEGVRNVELEEDIKHCEEVLADWHGCDECKADHQRLLSYMKELLEYRKYMSDKKYEGLKAVTDWIKNCPSEEFMRTFNELKDDYSGPTIGDFLGDSADTEGGYYDINEDFKEIIEKLKKLDINISNLIQIYDNHRIEGKDFDLVYYTRLHIKKCIKNIESLSFLKGI